ncbi:hypothetical protein BGV71_08155 [Burkholderia ubonensis]|uniref:hypothetical protein n=1 Tax=Burkholderia ubonensis TaxID=101571 RepID=UPI0008FE42BA|nr:hypothetical protein [Burkholderia ubonensis]OJA89697.1 hypothetical protein BGV71_08155 [Burkholderia ubonensis]
MADSNVSPVNSGSVRKQIRDAHEAALSVAFEEAHRLLDRIDEIKASLPQAGTGSGAQLVDAVEQARAAIVQLGQSVKQDIEATAQRERLNVTEAIREGAVAAGQEGAAKAINTETASAVATLKREITSTVKPVLEELRTMRASKAPQSSNSFTWGKLTAFALLVAVLVLAGQSLITLATRQSDTATHEAAMWGRAVTSAWRSLPLSAQQILNNTYQQLKQQ